MRGHFCNSHLPADLRRRGPSHCCPSRPPRGISTAAGPQFVIPGRGSRGPVLISAGRLHPRVVDPVAGGEQQPLPVWIRRRRLLCRPLRRPVLRLRPPAVRPSWTRRPSRPSAAGLLPSTAVAAPASSTAGVHVATAAVPARPSAAAAARLPAEPSVRSSAPHR